MYLMHKYWARKPHNVVGEYIDHYSEEGELVLDPFCGSGVTAIEALRRKRKAIATDLDPMSTFITRMTITPADLKSFEKAFKDIKGKLQEKIDSLYETICPRCGAHVPAEAVVWKGDKPVEIRLSCRCAGKTIWKKPTRFDFQKLKEIENKKIPYWYPNKELIWNTRINVNKGERVSDLFTKRNLYALSMIFHDIEAIKKSDIRKLMKFTFSSTLGQASKMVFVIRQRGRAKGKVEKSKPEVGSWATRGYWVPPEFFEINAWNCFEQRYRKVYRGKGESNDEIPKAERARTFAELKERKDFLIETLDVLELSKSIPDESVDYVFTDPPYGDSVPYLELDYMWSSWLGFEPDFDSEIIISDSPERREKNFEMYHKMLCAAFREVYRTLKKGKYLTVTFHNTDIQIYNSIISSVILAGFDLEKIIYQPPARTSPKGLLAPYGSAVGDYYIRFRKPEKERGSLSDEEIDKERYERIVVEAIKQIIAKRGEPTPYSVIVNNYSSIYEKLKDNGFLFSAPQTVEQILKKQLNKEFVLKDSKWWFKDASVVPYIERVPLNERVEKVTLNVLNKKIKVTFDDVLREIFILFPNALTPDIQSVRQVLSELAIQTKDGKWMLKPNIKKRESEHDKIVEILAKIGEKAGYGVYADLPEYRGKLEFPSIPHENLERIREIDVLWYDPKEIAYGFEVENTTGITEAIVRGSNIPTAKTKRFIVIPEERQSKFHKKISEPMLREKIEQYNWGFIFYDRLITFYEQNKKKKTIDVEEFNTMCNVPKLKTEKQHSIEEFNQNV
jgi:DNA modification methylase